MPSAIDAKHLQELLDTKDAQLIEVLPAREYEEEHLPGAINIPLKSFSPENLSKLDRGKPVIVYCWDDN
jgi:rhodanese-related sulfurtransferase